MVAEVGLSLLLGLVATLRHYVEDGNQVVEGLASVACKLYPFRVGDGGQGVWVGCVSSLLSFCLFL